MRSTRGPRWRPNLYDVTHPTKHSGHRCFEAPADPLEVVLAASTAKVPGFLFRRSVSPIDACAYAVRSKWSLVAPSQQFNRSTLQFDNHVMRLSAPLSCGCRLHLAAPEGWAAPRKKAAAGSAPTSLIHAEPTASGLEAWQDNGGCHSLHSLIFLISLFQFFKYGHLAAGFWGFFLTNSQSSCDLVLATSCSNHFHLLHACFVLFFAILLFL